MTTTIRNVQYQHLVDMLNFNLPESPSRPVWKLFVMDAAGQKILGPLIKVNDLREHGVTLFLQLKAHREKVPDVPVVYFIEPSTESVSLIIQDLQANLYDSYYLNFTSQISRDLLEELAQAAHQTGTHIKIAKVYDQYLNYITLEDNLFTLEIPKLTGRLFSPNDASSLPVIENTASGIFSVLMSFGCCAPLICCPQGDNNSFIKGVCGKLESRIKNHLINTKSPLSLSNPQASPNQPRPLLLLVDRRIDLAAPLKHSSAYNALIDEILGLNSNQIQITATGKSFDIDKRDWFWRENSTKSFPKVAEAVESALKAYKTEYDRVLQTTPGMTEDLMKSAVNNTSENSNTTSTSTATSAALTPEQLKIAINVLPELTERKRLIDTHLQISTALLDSIKTRDLGTLFSLEQDIVTGALTGSSNPNAILSSEEIISTLKNPKIGNSQDKLRLLLIYLIYGFRNHSNNLNFVQEALDILKPTGDDLKALQSVLTILSSENSILTPNLLTANSSSAGSKATSPIEQPATSITSDFFSRLSSTTNVLVSSVKNLIPAGGNSESPLTKMVDSAYAQVTGRLQTLNTVNCIDPRPSKSITATSSGHSHSIDHVILFVIGGAAYSEYDHLLEHFNRNKALQNLKFTFGVTEILNPKKFLNQLSEIQKNQ